MTNDIAEEKRSRSHNQFIDKFHNPYVAVIIIAFSLMITVWAYYVSSDFLQSQAEDRFEFRVRELTSAVEDRMYIYESVLRGTLGLMKTSDNVTRQQWHEYVKNLELDRYWPGIQGIGYGIPVSPDQKEAHIASIRTEGFPDYVIKPEGERELYSAIIFLEPFDWRNKRAFGYDMWSNAVRQEAMRRARDTGAAAISGIITLVQETEQDVQKGFLIYLPLYEGEEDELTTVSDRQKAFKGWVYSAFRADDLLDGILERNKNKANMDFEIYDGAEIKLDALLYDSNDDFHGKGDFLGKSFTKYQKIELQGRIWILYFHSNLENLVSSHERRQPVIFLAAGLFINLILAYSFFSLISIHRRVRKLADEQTQELEERANDLNKVKLGLEKKVLERTKELEQARLNLESEVVQRTEELESRVNELNRFNSLMVGREARMVELKKEIRKLKEQIQNLKSNGC